MNAGPGDLNIGPESAALITQGLRSAMGELKAVGGGATGSLQGSGFGELTMTKLEAGGSGLADTFEEFCDRWEWGVRALVQNASALAGRLGLAAGAVYEEDQYWQGTFKVAVNAMSPTGNPHATEDEVVKEGWGDLFTPDAPDYSADSFSQAGQQMEQTWKDTGRSLLTEGTGGLRTSLVNSALGVDDQDFQQQLDQAFGPSPAARAQQAAQAGAPQAPEGR